MQYRWGRRKSVLLQGFGTLCLLGLISIGSVQAQTRPLVLISEATSTRAIALESITFSREPFPVTSLISWRPDTRTRIIVFALNLRLQPGEELTSVTADAQDGTNRHYPLGVEYVESVPGQRWMSAVCLRLNDEMGDVGDVLVRINHQGRASNRVRVAIDYLGGGPVDDPGSIPTPVPSPYLISGRVTDEGSPVAGATVALSGDASAVTTTDSLGNYSILAAPSGDYLLSSSHQDYTFAPPNYSLPQVDGARQADFVGTFHGPLRGRITNAQGQGVFGVKVELRGTQTGTTLTETDGTYSFPVPAFGNYQLIPSKGLNYYAFAPQTISINGNRGSRRGDFAASLHASTTPSHVLEFDGTQKSVDYSMRLPDDYNLFWPDGLNYGHFFWEFWAMPGANASGTYLISDGYGGAHAILFGVGNFGTIPGRYQLSGNVWNGSNLTSFGSDEGPAPNEWGHLGVGWDGTNITTYFNGVPVGKTPYIGPRITPGGGQGCGRLLIGGSDHQNFVGRIAQVRGFENNNPREEIGSSVFATFAPQTVFSVDGNLLSYFFRPSLDVDDLSRYGQYGREHPGRVRSTANGVINEECPGCPVPQFVVDPTAPDFANPNQPGQPTAPVDTPNAVPNGALIFDSFSRASSTYVLRGVGGLQSSEGGSLGSKTWQMNEPGTGPRPFGILTGHAVLLANTTALAWINTGSGGTNFDIRIDRRPRTFGTGHNTGISFRVVDSNNYYFAYSSDSANTSQPQTLTVGYRVAGLRTVLTSGVSLPNVWTTLQVVTTGAGAVLVYADGTLVYSTSSTLLANSDGMGLYNNGPGLGLTNRWDNFRVFVAQP